MHAISIAVIFLSLSVSLVSAAQGTEVLENEQIIKRGELHIRGGCISRPCVQDSQAAKKDKTGSHPSYDLTNRLMSFQDKQVQNFRGSAFKALKEAHDHSLKRAHYREKLGRNPEIGSWDALDKEDKAEGQSSKLALAHHKKLHAAMVAKSNMLDAGFDWRPERQTTTEPMVHADEKSSFAPWLKRPGHNTGYDRMKANIESDPGSVFSFRNA